MREKDVAVSEDTITRLLKSFTGKRVAVVGDVMLDRYFWGSVHRISPEAPVPVVEVESESLRLGGAANVAHNIRSLGGEPLLVGLVGDDHPGEQFREMLAEMRLSPEGIVTDAGRPTTIKTRVIAAGQHVVRVDNESKQDAPEDLERRLIDAVRGKIHTLDAILIEDYNKGVVTRGVIRDLTALALKHDKVITVDPKFNNFLEYREVTLFKPNRREVEEVLGGRLGSEAEVEAAGRQLLEALKARNVLLTRGAGGMALFEADGAVTHIPSTAVNVQDVSGAGDTVISTLTLALASGVGARQACMLANCAAGIVVASVGIVPITQGELAEAAKACRQLHAAEA
jgi:rfaE bifunctional protein kinase chain/domain